MMMEPMQKYGGPMGQLGKSLPQTDLEMLINMGISSLTVFSGVLIASTINPITGIEVWGSPTGNPGTWELLYTAAPGFDSSLDSYNGYEYIGTGTNNLASLSRTDNLIT
jgi:hypothetical protein